MLTDLSGQYRNNSGPTSVLAARQAVEDFLRHRVLPRDPLRME